MPGLNQMSSGTTVLYCKNEKTREQWWLATIYHVRLSGLISNLLPSLGKLVHGRWLYVNAVKLVIYNFNQQIYLLIHVCDKSYSYLANTQIITQRQFTKEQVKEKG